jgi:hypothetical protein
MDTNNKFFIFLEIISLIGCLIIIIIREFKIDIINIILFLGIIFSTYKVLKIKKKDNVA